MLESLPSLFLECCWTLTFVCCLPVPHSGGWSSGEGVRVRCMDHWGCPGASWGIPGEGTTSSSTGFPMEPAKQLGGSVRLCHPPNEVKSLSRVQLCDPMDHSLPHSSVHGIFQARVLEWVAISFSRVFSRPRDRTWVSHIIGRRILQEPVAMVLSIPLLPSGMQLLSVFWMGQEVAGLCSLGEGMTWQNPAVPLTFYLVSNLGFFKKCFFSSREILEPVHWTPGDFHKGTVLCELKSVFKILVKNPRFFWSRWEKSRAIFLRGSVLFFPLCI